MKRALLKALIYAALLAWPGYLLAHAYQDLLLGQAGRWTGATLASSSSGSADLSAVNLLTVFVALCLASDFAPWRRRLLAILIGLPSLVLIDLASGVLTMVLRPLASPAPAPPRWQYVVQALPELVRWLAAPLAWGVLLGRKVRSSRAAVRG